MILYVSLNVDPEIIKFFIEDKGANKDRKRDSSEEQGCFVPLKLVLEIIQKEAPSQS
jgi:hypothetical protein